MTGMMAWPANSFAIAATGVSLGRTRLTLRDLGDYLRWPAELTARIEANGVKCLRYAEGQSLLDLANEATQRLLDDCPIDPSSIDVLLHVHSIQSSRLSADDSIPVSIARHFRMHRARCISISGLSCVSFFMALRLAHAIFERQPDVSRLLIVAADLAPLDAYRLVDDNGVNSDGGGALLLSRTGSENRVVSVALQTTPSAIDGHGSAAEKAIAGLYAFNTAKTIKTACAQAGIGLTDLRLILPHNVNLPGWTNVLRMLRLSPDILYRNNMHTVGHLYCADSALNLPEALRLSEGSHYLLYSNGASGFSGAAIVRR